jgi:hypothetical protein
MIARLGKAIVRAYLNADVRERFWSKVDRRGDGECWPWTGHKHERGYGHIRIKGQHRRASQLSWEIFNEKPFPMGLCALHSCDNPNCVNPAHIRAGTHADNMADKVARGRASRRLTHCRRGHEFTPENTLLIGGKRRCRTCVHDYRTSHREDYAAHSRAYYRRQKALEA